MKKLLHWSIGTVAACILTVTMPSITTADTPFIIENDAGFSDDDVARVRRQLDRCVAAFAELGLPVRTHKFPITVRLKPGRGISRSFHGAGPVFLFYVDRKWSPIIHELTHMLAGYTRENGHWTQEGLASFMQDRFGEDFAFPTRKRPHGVMKVILQEDAMLPMTDVMKDRDRTKFFTNRNRMNNWLAYSQSSSFTKFLIDTYGVPKFIAIYDKPFEKQHFRAHFGNSADALIAEWLGHIRSLKGDLTRARRHFKRIKRGPGQSGNR